MKKIFSILFIAILLLTGCGKKETAEEATENIISAVIEDKFSITDKGIVLSIRITSGTISVGDKVQIADTSGKKIDVEVIGMEQFQTEIESASEGDYAAVLVSGVNITDIGHLDMLITPNAGTITNTFEAELKLYSRDSNGIGRELPINSGYSPEFKLDNIRKPCTIDLLDGLTEAKPGETVKVKVTLDEPIIVVKGMKFETKEGTTYTAEGIVTSAK